MLQSNWSKFTNSPNCSSFWSSRATPAFIQGCYWLTSEKEINSLTCSQATGNQSWSCPASLQRPVSTTASRIEVPHVTGGLCVHVTDALCSQAVTVDG